MTKRDLLLEIGMEEIPARYVVQSMEQLEEKVKQLLTQQSIGFGAVESFSTPRRLAVLIKDVDEKQKDLKEEVRGPSKKVALDAEGNWTKAAIGFTRGQGKTVDDIYFKEVKGVEYVFVEKFTPGKDTLEVLKQLKDLILSITFPKQMRWGDLDIRYIRPIRWIVALFGDTVIPFDIANVSSSNETFGHRFLGEKITLNEPKEYKEKLLAKYVICDYYERRDAIFNQLKHLEHDMGWKIPVDPDLLDEVTNLVEYPTVLYGKFDEKFLQLPKEVLITTMKEHQRYFPVTDSNHKLLPYFVTVKNGDHNNLEIIAKGNEKVLKARLQDAVFFYEEDQKLSIEMALNKLKGVLYHDEIGTYKEKLERIRSLADTISQFVGIQDEEREDTLRAAEICKFDLVTQMVGEFPELQGFMGEQYAKYHGEKESVAKAINEHYMPRSSDGDLPETVPGAIVALSDKLDTLASLFAIGVIPTGSEDPYSLRRQATGVVQILEQFGWNIDLTALLSSAVKLTANFAKKGNAEIVQDLLHFFRLRFKHLLSEKGIRYDIIDGVLASPITSVKAVMKKAEIINARKDMEGFKEDLEALSRIINISAKAVKAGEIDTELFENDAETALFNEYVQLKNMSASADEETFYNLLVGMRPVINDYFDRTMVMAEEEKIRKNRLSLMKELADIICDYCHFQHIVVK